MSTFELYVLLQLPLLREVAIGMFAVSIVASIFSGFGAAMMATDEPESFIMLKKVFRWAISGVAFFGLLMAFVPDTKTILALVAYELGGNIEGLSELPADLVGYLRNMLDTATE